MMVALLVYAYAIGERSSRRIERRCREDVAFRVITANQVPDHATIARFRVRLGGKERGQIELADRVDHEPREVILGQPLAQARRQQQLLLAITRQEVLRHTGIVLIYSARTDPAFVRQRPGPLAAAVEE